MYTHSTMFRNNTNAAVPPFLGSNHFQCPADAPNQLQLCVDVDKKARVFNKNQVSTGLRLSYDDDERNSTISSASGSMTIGSSIFSSQHVDIERELDKNRKELEHYVRTQEENLLKGLREIRQRHFTSCLTYLENSCAKKLHQKNLELETVACKNNELVERAKQLTAEAENWCNIAKYNESVANALKSSLEQALQQVSNRGNMDGENDVDDAASCIDPNNFLSNSGERERSSSVNINALICRYCKSKEVSIVLMPCRHLCLCKECEGFVGACPVCRMIINARFEVYLS
ncbi:putative BOI-related E3 ubiquitin-protein ligase 2 isoform X3 [Primulina tabacum]|uniref:putative BOI-related E3 ubiquitin-protein ligase 2 isoform X3 n=1 Tax=Primulina tabacum TaxID=48773 RepID=UPI003F5A9A43